MYFNQRYLTHRISWAFSLISFFLFSLSFLAQAKEGDENVPIGVNEYLGKTVNLDFQFLDENGDTVTVAALVDRPTIISFVYYTCPNICSPLLNGLRHAVDKVQLEPGVDFNVVTISMNEDEGPELAREKKARYMQEMERDFPAGSWWWLTGDSTNIRHITDELGFAFRRTGDDFAHPAVIMVLSGKGKIARYLYGIDFNQFDLQMAIVEASQGRVGPTIAKVLKMCFSYDPTGRKYVFNFMRVAGSAVLLFAGLFLTVLIVRTRKNKHTSR